jgi:protein-tyrosine-phosphatase
MAGLLSQVLQLSRRLLQRSRRRAALAALVRASRLPKAILFVCHGNIFRSPFAAAVLRRALERGGVNGVRVESAGLIGAGRPVPRDAIATAARRGIDLSRHTSQLVLADVVRAAELVVVMDELQRRMVCERFGRWPRDVLLLGDFDPTAVTSRAIEDPVEQGPEVCERVYARIERCVAQLADALQMAMTSTSPL